MRMLRLRIAEILRKFKNNSKVLAALGLEYTLFIGMFFGPVLRLRELSHDSSIKTF